ncbi:MAG: glutamine-hydrolyzing GMP synthase [Thermoplasmata archaeon]|nr:glutamine-hydrolyzing GMP synthase [Thermoplasmata archaeon]MCI4359889.1 glutamine-hydrolyzing GMP synthase [Thermoplasmata archaeon]
MRDPESFRTEAVERLRAAVPGQALVAASGGIDSTAAAVLAKQALGPRARALFVDTGLLREGETDRVRRISEALKLDIEVVPAAETFFAALDGVTDPEEKRRRIGAAFIRLFEREAKQTAADRLVQGTIAPDWIESGGQLRDTIKTHHNVGGVPKDSTLTLVEPLRDLYKDEVRALAVHLGIPEAHRQPFPGPGLAVRVIGPVTEARVRSARRANAIVEEEVDRAVDAGTLARPWQYFAVLLPVRTVGVLGDNRVWGEAVSVRIVESIDAMTATAVAPPAELLRRIAERITRELSGTVPRVLYDVTDKPPATIEWE